MSLAEKEKIAIERLKMFEPNKDFEPYYLAYSGGKDSDAILILAQLAGVRFEAVHNLTTAGAPETVNYVRSKGNVRIDYPDTTMWNLIVQKRMPPTRLVRYCCSELKERGGERRRVITGVRWAESKARREHAALVTIHNKPKKVAKLADELGVSYNMVENYNSVMLNNDNEKSRELVEDCYRQHKTVLNPILDWTDDEVWEFLHHYGCESNPLYQCGFKRIGCIGCPMAGRKGRYFEFNKFPKYKLNYTRAFDRMIKSRVRDGLETQWESGEEVFKWWLEEDPYQLSFFDGE